MSKIKLCKYCKTELPSKGNICPQCEKKQGMNTISKVIIALFVIGVIGSTFGETEDVSTNNKDISIESADESENIIHTNKNQNLDSATKHEKIENVTDFLVCPTLSSEPNTSSMIDEIASIAKKNASAMSDEQAAEIIEIIQNADHKFYNGSEEMEKFMWYGYLLDYKYVDSDPRSELGTDLCQAIKYVYRNVETVLDDATHENLLQIDKDLEKIK